jgi:hypothetical protein
MTRFLSEALEAQEPFFRSGVKRLEAANGHPNADIRFSTEVERATRTKLRELGLDPRDTTPEELYHVLQERIKADDARLTRTLRLRAATHVSADGDIVAGMIHAIQVLPDSKRCFALKTSVLKAMIKRQPPKNAMKRLGYRSLDSFLKHETPVLILAAAWLSEGASWQRRLVDQYKKLRPSDFEDRKIVLLRPVSDRWRRLASETVADKRHNLISFREAGALVFLPLSPDAPAGTTTASLALALHELNEIRTAGTFLKLAQVRREFGKIVQVIAGDDLQIGSQLLDQPVPWHLIQRYYGGLTHHERETFFEPHLQLEDIAWHPIEETLAAIEPSFGFWRQSAHLGLAGQQRPVSLNVVDAALNYCNQLPFEQRVAHYFQRSMWQELLLRYLRPEAVEKALLGESQPRFAEELAAA